MLIYIKEASLDLVSLDSYSPLSPGEMYEFLKGDLPSLDEGDFWRIVQEMESEDFSIAFTRKNKIMSAAALGQHKGVYSASSKGGFGFVTTEDGEFFVPPSLTVCALNGDTVVCKKLDRG